ncbi:MAG TPA: adenylosuccinate lyase, partial [Coxiellaceae bacterium]|nr:adenylosuccinate lyase [Coxiellaceae bacterium]
MPNPTKLSTLTSLSPLDGRYGEQLADVTSIFSELHLILMRLTIEIEWLKTLAHEPKIKEVKPLSHENLKFLHNIIAEFDTKDINHIKEL